MNVVDHREYQSVSSETDEVGIRWYLKDNFLYFSIKHFLLLIRIASPSRPLYSHNIGFMENWRKLSFNYHQIIHVISPYFGGSSLYRIYCMFWDTVCFGTLLIFAKIIIFQGCKFWDISNI